MSQEVDILNMEWSHKGRDMEMVLPIRFYCEKVLGLTWQSASIFDYYALYKYKPRLLFLTNSTGAEVNYNLVKYAKGLGLPVITLTSEGNFKNHILDQMIWGWNIDRVLYEDIWCVWSEKTKNMVLNKHPQLEGRVRVSGAVGHDKYKLLRFMSKEEICAKYEKYGYKKIIGYAGWIFDGLHYEDGKRKIVEVYGKEIAGILEQEEKKVNIILKDIIKNNQDILFIIKKHPGEIGTRSEMTGLNNYGNAIVLKNEEAIGDLINVSDIWMNYDSSTMLEAWSLGKPTININPSIVDFTRDENYKGSIVVYSLLELQKMIDEYYGTGQIKAFEEKQAERKRIIKDTIQWDDGKNHIRVANFIKELLDKSKDVYYARPELKVYVKHCIYVLSKYLPVFVQKLPKIRNYSHIHEKFNCEELKKNVDRYFHDLTAFYAKEGIN